ncbi:MAG: endonuclease domain-containing protein, partial [bacterium]|nr:endonuclease domain-containing protein [bacterium]
KLWHRIRKKQLRDVQFFRQRPVGQYIVDFYCPTKKLVIEIDGGQHFTIDGVRADRKRDDILSTLGMRILRFDDREVLTNIEGILERILENL